MPRLFEQLRNRHGSPDQPGEPAPSVSAETICLRLGSHDEQQVTEALGLLQRKCEECAGRTGHAEAPLHDFFFSPVSEVSHGLATAKLAFLEAAADKPEWRKIIARCLISLPANRNDRMEAINQFNTADVIRSDGRLQADAWKKIVFWNLMNGVATNVKLENWEEHGLDPLDDFWACIPAVKALGADCLDSSAHIAYPARNPSLAKGFVSVGLELYHHASINDRPKFEPFFEVLRQETVLQQILADKLVGGTLDSSVAELMKKAGVGWPLLLRAEAWLGRLANPQNGGLEWAFSHFPLGEVSPANDFALRASLRTAITGSSSERLNVLADNADFGEPARDLLKQLRNETKAQAIITSCIEAVTNFSSDGFVFLTGPDSPVSIRSLLRSFHIETREDFLKHLKLFQDLLSALLDYKLDPTKEVMVNPALIKTVKKMNISTCEAECLLRAGFELEDLEKDRRQLFAALSEHAFNWQEGDNISAMFLTGAEVLGYDKLFAFSNKPGVSRHDSLIGITDIISVFRQSGLTVEHFWTRILDQVYMDNANYPEGSSHHHLNALADGINLTADSKRIVEAARDFPELPFLAELSEMYSDRNKLFGSWKSFKRFAALSRQLQQLDMMKKIALIRRDGKQKLADYLEALAFHPSSQVNIQAVFEFVLEPEKFIDRNDAHAIGNAKKPSNYVEIPYLDLTAVELRDALVDGAMDTIQVFPPMEATYTFLKQKGRSLEESLTSLPPRELLKELLGSRREKVEGKALDPGGLFSQISKHLKAQGVDLKAYLAGEVALNLAAEKELHRLAVNSPCGLLGQIETVQYKATLFPKSSPKGVVAGNDTACCMPFGSGKNTVYQFNPNCVHFVVQTVDADGTGRTIAQSVLHKDRSIGRNVSSLLSFHSESMDLTRVVPDMVLVSGENFLTCDNIEVAPNFRITTDAKFVLRAIYRNFFSTYIDQLHPEMPDLSTEKILVGYNYTHCFEHLGKEPNTFVPLAPPSYTDNSGVDTLVMPLARRIRRPLPPATGGVLPLTFEDSIATGYMEALAYRDNRDLMSHLSNMESALIAKDINNAAKKRPNLSFKYLDKDARMRAYMLAYEGNLRQEELQEVPMHFHKLVRDGFVYISDLASDRHSSSAVAWLFNHFLEEYAEHYFRKGRPIPILLDARGQTSWKLLRRGISKLGNRQGMSFDLIPTMQHAQGGEQFQQVLLVPRGPSEAGRILDARPQDLLPDLAATNMPRIRRGRRV